eukprot:g3605.t1
MENAAIRENVPSPGAPGFTDYRQNVGWINVTAGYKTLCRNLFTFLLIPLALFLNYELIKLYSQGYISEIWLTANRTDLKINLVTFGTCALLLVLVAVSFFFLRNRPVYLVDFQLYRPPDHLKVSHEKFIEVARASGRYSTDSLSFQEKIMAKSGLGEETYLPFSLLSFPYNTSMKSSREETAAVMFTTIEKLLKKSNLDPQKLDILVVNCSSFSPTPSLAAMIINHFKMRSDIIVYNLSGMGCSAGLTAIDLARQMLQLTPSARALVFSTENLTQNWHWGNTRSMLIANCLFRLGGAAVLLSNKRRDYWRAKYELSHVVRTDHGATDCAFTCMYQLEDEENNVGLRLSKGLMSIAGEALKANITTLAPLVLPIYEQIKFFFNFVLRRRNGFRNRINAYIPNFKHAFDHFCIHPGGRGIIEEIEKQLKLTHKLIKPSKATLQRFGNTSSSSVWYVLGYVESHQEGVRKGDTIWQIAYGSGFKCNSIVWKAMRRISEKHEAWN